MRARIERCARWRPWCERMVFAISNPWGSPPQPPHKITWLIGAFRHYLRLDFRT